MSSTNVNLHGEFKVDVLDCSRKVIRTSNYIKNFITNVGSSYPYYFAFADCFRYLSLGTGTGQSSTGLSMAATTGLISGMSNFAYIDSGNYSTGGYLGGGCGNFANPNSNTITLIRQWGLPDITGGVFGSPATFTELMVSPGRPYVPAFTDNTLTVPTGLCSCSEVGYNTLGGGSPDTTGKDCSQIAIYYSLLPQVGELANNQFGTSIGSRPRLKLCDAAQAFARITGNFPVGVNESLSITYQLNLTFNTGVSVSVFGSVFPTANDHNFNAIGIASKITNPGIKLIVDSSLNQSSPTINAPVNNRLQQFDYSNSSSVALSTQYGESFIPSLGIPLEPSCVYGPQGNFSVYISDDNTQFLVSATGGNVNTGLYQPWNPAGLNLPQNSGLMGFNTLVSGNNASGAINDGGGGSYWSLNPYDIRTSSSSITYPTTGDVSTSTTISPNIYTGIPSYAFYNSGNRGGSIVTNYQFPNFSLNIGFGAVTFLRSYVVGYVDAAIMGSTFSNVTSSLDSVSIMPFWDSITSGRSGNSTFLPSIITGSSDNTTPTTISGALNTGYNYFTGQNGSYFPSFIHQLTWISDCPAGVDGC